jgi:NADPH-dependent 2,4-dienoyl-CoA reductase/sulfur reductase-like enzyme/rhodanese-related sulfurtransferase
VNKPKKIVIIGGSAAGPKCAARARRLDQNAKITIIQKEPYLSMASCGYPYYVGGCFDDRNMLLSTPTGVVRDPDFFLNAKDIEALTETEAVSIDRQNRKVQCRNINSDETRWIDYDKLVIATGSVSRKPPLPGIDLDGITTLQSIRDADYLREVRDKKHIKKAVVVGGGLIGIETCEALHLAGIDITVVELLPQILTFLDWELARILENYLKSQGAEVITGSGVAEFIGHDGKLTGIKLMDGREIPAELAVIAIGVSPNSKLAKDADIKTGETGGIAVNEHLQTSDPDIYAIGDCIELNHMVTGRKTLSPMGDLANLQGRVAGENLIAGNSSTFPGTIQTGVCKIFDYTAGSTGLSEANARKFGLENIISIVNAGPDKPFFMGGKLLVSKMVADLDTGKIIGFQCVGPGDVSKQVTQAAMAIHGGLKVSDILNADLPYAPPFSLAIDHFISTSHILDNKMKGFMTGISSHDVKQKVEKGDNVFLLDVRGPDEYEAMRLDIGETLIPLDALRKRLEDLPADKDAEIICFCKISLRGYEASRILQGNGWNNVKVMEGGIMAWPFEKKMMNP